MTSAEQKHYSGSTAKDVLERMGGQGKEMSQKALGRMQMRSKETQTEVVRTKGERYAEERINVTW